MNNSPARLFFGKVMHHRLRPAANRFVYPVHFCLLPLSRIEDAAGTLFSVNRWNLFSFHFADHGARDGSHPLTWIRSLLQQEGIDADGEVWLQCFPRLLGFVFNPISLWFCHDRAGQLIAVLAKVTIPRQSRGLSVAGPSKGPIRDGQKAVPSSSATAIPELDGTTTPPPSVSFGGKADSRKCQTVTVTPAEPGVFSG